jgi:lipoprotein-anchoring transpeptidase ErfK/SrfK
MLTTQTIKALKMMKYIYCLGIVWFGCILALPAAAVDVFAQYDKVIWINQAKQVGAAYEQGKKLYEFPIITGDDETPTPPGIYVVRVKDEDYYSRKYDTPMPYSIFFDFKGKRAIHEGEVPEPALKKTLATHGCIHVERPYIERLFDWTEAGKTVVVIQGSRDDDED